MRRSQHTPYWAAPKRASLPPAISLTEEARPSSRDFSSPQIIYLGLFAPHTLAPAPGQRFGDSKVQRSLCVPLRSSRAGGRTGRHRDAPRRWHTSCLLSPTVLVAGVLVPHWGLKRGLPSCPQLRTVQAGAPSTGPVSCHAGPKRKPRRGVPTEPEGARSSSPRANGQCKSHQVSITHAGDSRNSLLGGSAVRGT